MGNNAELTERIVNPKQKRNAVILTHNYQRGEAQDIFEHNNTLWDTRWQTHNPKVVGSSPTPATIF